MKSKRQLISWVAGIVALFLAVPLLLSVVGLLPWSPINCRHQDVDIATGRLRYTRYLLYCKISERIENSALSKMLPEDVVSSGKPEWYRVNTFSPGLHHSPHYIFHGAINTIQTLNLIWEMYRCSEDLKKQTALHVLALWQYSGSDSLAGDYVAALGAVLEKDGDKPQQTLSTLLTLKMPVVETNGTNVTQSVFFPNGQVMDRTQGYLDRTGAFVRHGTWEQWRSNGERSLYGHFENGEDHGLRLEWDKHGKLIAIKVFNQGHLSDYESKNLEQHPDYKVAQQIGAANPNQPVRPETNRTPPAAGSRR